MRDILAAKPQDRLETVRKALGVEKYRLAADNAQELATDLRRTANALRSESELLRHFDDDFAAASQDANGSGSKGYRSKRRSSAGRWPRGPCEPRWRSSTTPSARPTRTDASSRASPERTTPTQRPSPDARGFEPTG